MESKAGGAAGAATATLPRWDSRTAALGFGLLGALALAALLCAAAVVLIGGIDTSPARAEKAGGPVGMSRAWLARHDYQLVAQFRGARTMNVTAVRHGRGFRGDVQTVSASGVRQIHYYRFRVSADGSVTTTTGAARWEAATWAQQILVNRVADAHWLLAPFASRGSLRSLGRSGDAQVYRDRRGDELFTIDGRPARVVTHRGKGIWTFVVHPGSGTSPR